jgi:YihY family inner membrane protein
VGRNAAAKMNPMERVVRRFDRYQQSHRWLGLPFAIIKKFGDDRAGALAALIAYYGFFALFPLLLLMTAALGFAMGRNTSFATRVVHSTLATFPIIGNQIQSNLHALRATGPSLAIGLGGLGWAARGLSEQVQHAMQEVWNVPGQRRPNFFKRLGRGFLMLVIIGSGIIATTLLSGLVTFGGHTAPLKALTLAISVTLNVALFYFVFRVTAPQAQWRDLLPGAILAGSGWQVLQAIGSFVVGHQLRTASQLYGFFGVVLGLLAWMYLAAEITLYAAEFNVVRAQHLWPRSIVQPPLTEPDQRALGAIAKREERRPEETVEVTFDQP